MEMKRNAPVLDFHQVDDVTGRGGEEELHHGVVERDGRAGEEVYIAVSWKRS